MKFSLRPDKDLILSLKQGSIKAYEALFAKYRTLVGRFIASIVRDAAVAEDLTQDVFMTLWSARKEFDPDLPIRSWLYVTSRNKAVNWLKGWAGRKVQLEEEQADEALREDFAVDYETAVSRLEKEMESLPPRCREVFRMSRLEGKTREEIASSLGIALRTVDKHLEVAGRTLRKHFN